VAGTPSGTGKTLSIDITETKGHIEDWLSLFVKSSPALTGSMNFRARVAFPSEQRRFLNEMTLQGDFGIDTMRFTRFETRENVNSLSERAQGEKAGSSG